MRESKGFWLSWQRGAGMCVPTNRVNASSWSPLPYMVHLYGTPLDSIQITPGQDIHDLENSIHKMFLSEMIKN